MKAFLPIHLLIVLLMLLSFGAIFSYVGFDGIAWFKHLGNFAGLFFSSYAVSLLLQRFFRVPHARIEHRLITAFILFLLFDPFLPSWIFFLIGAFTELSQRLLRTAIGPIFNPAAFTAFTFGLAGHPAGWWGVNFPPFLPTHANVSVSMLLTVSLAGYVAYRYRKLSIVLSFLITFGLANSIIFGKDPIFLIMDGAIAFFLLVMVVEPKTSSVPIQDQFIYGAIVGVGVLLAMKAGWFDPILGALLVANLYAARKFLLSLMSKLAPFLSKERRLISGTGD